MGRYAQARRRGRGIPIGPAMLEPPVYDEGWVIVNGNPHWSAQGICPFPAGARITVQIAEDEDFTSIVYDATGAACDLDEDTGVLVSAAFTRARWVNDALVPISNWSPAETIP